MRVVALVTNMCDVGRWHAQQSQDLYSSSTCAGAQAGSGGLASDLCGTARHPKP